MGRRAVAVVIFLAMVVVAPPPRPADRGPSSAEDLAWVALRPPGPAYTQLDDPTVGRAAIQPPCEPADLASIQLVHAVPAGEAGASDAVERWRTNARWMNGDLVRGAQRAGGGDRQLRFATDPECAVDVLRIEFTSGPGALPAVLAIRDELQRLGHSRPDRVYLAWADGHPGDPEEGACGVANRIRNDLPAPQNDQQGREALYGVLLDDCADAVAGAGPLHELLHMLGAVQESAPNFTSAGHVGDGSDLMTEDGSPGTRCTEQQDLFTPDCGHDDYFHPAPPAGSYLATHWNVADSPQLSTAAVPGGPTEPAPAPPPPPPAPPSDPHTPPDLRFGEADVAARAVAVAEARFPDETLPAHRVLLARDDEFADSLAASSLQLLDPLLYTGREALPDVTAQAIRRLLDDALTAGTGSLEVVLLGGESAISDGVRQQVEAIAPSITVQRVAGPSRVETAIAVADLLGSDRGVVAIARAGGPADNPSAAWADSIAAGALVAAEGIPLLLTLSDQLHPAVAEWLAGRAVSTTYVLGGTAAITDGVAAQLPGEVRRLAGPSRDSTAAAINRARTDRTGEVEIAFNGYTADGWQDGLLAAGLATDWGATVLLVDRDTVPPATAELAAESCAYLTIIGTEDTVSDAVSDALVCAG